MRYTPLLPTVADYHIRYNSPAVDTGFDNGVSPDYDGEARTAAAYDVGADEYVAPIFTAVAVLSPGSGETIPSGSTYTIQWGAPATADHYRVQYSVNGGVSWVTLAASVVGQTHFDWTVPTPVLNLTRCVVRVLAYDATNHYLGLAKSAGFFTIEVVRLLTPNGIELLSGGSVYPVTWQWNATRLPVTRAKIEWSRDNGLTYFPIAIVPVAIGDSFGTHPWTVPRVNGVLTSVRVRVTLLAGATVVGRDMSDGRITIRPSLAP